MTTSRPRPISTTSEDAILHERVLIVTARTSEVPRVDPAARAEVYPLGAGVTRVILTFGFLEYPDIPGALSALVQRDDSNLDIDPHTITYITGRETAIPSKKIVGMSYWREQVFAFLRRNSQHTAVYFGIPAAQVIEIGTKIEI